LGAKEQKMTSEKPSGNRSSGRNNRGRRRRKGGGKKPEGSGQNAAAGGASADAAANKAAAVSKKAPPLPKAPDLPPRKYGVAFYDSFLVAKAQLEEIRAQAAAVDQLNIVILADGDMDDPELTAHGKVFAGEAWTLIHKRRVEDGWYEVPHVP